MRGTTLTIASILGITFLLVEGWFTTVHPRQNTQPTPVVDGSAANITTNAASTSSELPEPGVIHRFPLVLDGTKEISNVRGDKLLVKEGASSTNVLESSGQPAHQDIVEFIPHDGNPMQLYATAVPLGDKSESINRVSIELSPTGRYALFESVFYEEGATHIIDTKTGVDVMTQAFPGQKLLSINVSALQWSPDDTWFVFHSAYGSSDYSYTAGIFVFNSVTGKLDSVDVGLLNYSEGFIDYDRLQILDTEHISFDKLHFPQLDNYDKSTAMLMGSYTYDVSTGVLTKK